MGTTIAISNQKGGTGKTTTALNLAAALAKFHKRKVLLIDLDPQGSLTTFLGVLPEQLEFHVGSVLDSPSSFDEALMPYYTSSLKILPSHPLLKDLNKSGKLGAKLKKKVESLFMKANEQFDFVIIDCPPSMDAFTFEVYCNANSIIVPLQCEYMALRGLQLVLKTVEEARENHNPDLKIMGLLPTMYDGRTLHSKEVLEEIRAALEGITPLFDVVINRTVRLPESTVALLPIFEYTPRNVASKAYRKLAKEVNQYG